MTIAEFNAKLISEFRNPEVIEIAVSSYQLGTMDEDAIRTAEARGYAKGVISGQKSAYDVMGHLLGGSPMNDIDSALKVAQHVKEAQI